MRYLFIIYARKPNGQIDELVSISKKVKPSDQQTVNVILDFVDKKIAKCVIEGKKHDTDWNNMITYYKKVYPVLIEQLEKANSDSTKKV